MHSVVKTSKFRVYDTFYLPTTYMVHAIAHANPVSDFDADNVEMSSIFPGVLSWF